MATHDKDLAIICELRKNARSNLVEIAASTNVPKSTVFDKIRKLGGGVIKKHTCIIDFKKLGFNTRYVFLVRTTLDERQKLGAYLSSHPQVNNLHITNSDFDYLFECIFKDSKEMNDFKELLAHRFPILLIKQHELIEDLHREKFLETWPQATS